MSVAERERVVRRSGVGTTRRVVRAVAQLLAAALMVGVYLVVVTSGRVLR
jgi:hypothetical protein